MPSTSSRTSRQKESSLMAVDGKKLLNLDAAVAMDASLDRTVILEITNLLQTSLDPEEVLKLFKQELGQLVGIDSLHFKYPPLDLDINLEKPERHSTNYHLYMESQDLGQILLTRDQRFSRAELEKLERLLCALFYPLRNALTHQHALKAAFNDELTGAQNRAAFELGLPREISLAQRHGQPFALMIIDLDRFKQINDSLGHAAGDLILKQVAGCIRECIRGSDLFYRYGGEEFILLLSNTNQTGAQLLAERSREAVSRLEVSHAETRCTATISIGLAALMLGESAQTLFERADAALYQAKRAGRNRVELACA